MPLDITALWGGLLALWMLILQGNAIRLRRKYWISIGTGGKEDLAFAVRAHGNAVESIPLGIVLLAVSEGIGTPAHVLHALGFALLVGRLAHGIVFLRHSRPIWMRVVGMVLTQASIGLLALGLVAHAIAGVQS